MSDNGWPTVATYLDWARRQGCTVEMVECRRGDRSLFAVTIRAPSGAQVREIVAETTDPLMSTTIARLDRHLGLKSGLFR